MSIDTVSTSHISNKEWTDDLSDASGEFSDCEEHFGHFDSTVVGVNVDLHSEKAVFVCDEEEDEEGQGQGVFDPTLLCNGFEDIGIGTGEGAPDIVWHGYKRSFEQMWKFVSPTSTSVASVTQTTQYYGACGVAT
jgi:hypothetical protein